MLNRIWNQVERWLKLRPHSAWEIEMYLSQRVKKWTNKYAEQLEGASPEELKKRLLSQIEELGFINDERFARWWAEQRVEFKKYGSIRIRSELIKRRVDRKIIDAVIKELVEPVEKELAKDWANRVKLKQSEWKKPKKIRYLASKGFSYSLIRELI